MKKYFLFTLLSALIIFQESYAQEDKGLKTILTADSLASGNAKDVLTSFFQLALDNLTGENKELNFSSNPYAVMLKSNPGLALDRNYYKYRVLRKTNFSFGLKLDTSFRFNGFSSGIKYALINKRDSSTSKLLFQGLKNDRLGRETDKIQLSLIDYAKEIADLTERKKFVGEVREFFNSDKAFNKLSKAIQNAVRTIITEDPASYPIITEMVNNNPDTNIVTQQWDIYNRLKDQIKDELLWTVSLSDTTYRDHFFFSNLVLKTELLKGIGQVKKGSNWELNIQAAFNVLDDSLSSGRDLKRSIFNIEPGINWVIRNGSNDQSFFECKFSGSYSHHFSRLYENERRDSLTFNATVRIRIIDEIWLPLEIKYDPRSGNVFGFLNVRANFSSLGKLAKGKN